MADKNSPLRAIRAKCLECSCNNSAEVRECVIPDCALYAFRMGKNPNRKGIGRKGAVPPINPYSTREKGA